MIATDRATFELAPGAASVNHPPGRGEHHGEGCGWQEKTRSSLRCRTCGVVTVPHSVLGPAVAAHLVDTRGFLIEGIDVVFTGICGSCRSINQP